MDGVLFVARTGCQWNALNATDLCSSSTAHRRFQEWREAGVFVKLWQSGLEVYDELKGLDWSWLSMDGAMTKSPLGGEKNRPESHGSIQIRHQAKSVGRSSRRSDGTGRRGSERQRLQVGAGDDRKHSRAKTTAVAAPPAQLVSGQRVWLWRGAYTPATVGDDRTHPFARKEDDDDAPTRRPTSAALGGGTNAQLDESVPPGAHPLGKETGKLSSHCSSEPRMDLFPMLRIVFGIGSKQDVITHPFLNEEIQLGLIPHVQAMLLSRHLRGDLDGYPPFLWKWIGRKPW
jgi:transposase